MPLNTPPPPPQKKKKKKNGLIGTKVVRIKEHDKGSNRRGGWEGKCTVVNEPKPRKNWLRKSGAWHLREHTGMMNM